MNEAKSPMRMPRGMEMEELLNDGGVVDNIERDGKWACKVMYERASYLEHI